MAEAVGDSRLLTRAFVALMVADFLYFTAAGMLLAATPLYARDELGAGDSTIGLVMGSFSITTLLLRPFVGRWSDRNGRRVLLVGGAAAFSVVVLGHLVADSVITLVVVRLALGAAEACFFIAGFAALADLAPPGRAGAALSINSLALYLGIAVGPLVAQVLLRFADFRVTWLVAAALTAAASVAAWQLPETHGQPDRAGGRWIHPAAIGPGVVLFVGVGVGAGFLAFAVLHAREVGLGGWAVVPLCFGAAVVLMRILFADLPDRADPFLLVTGALLGEAAGLAVLGWWDTPAGAIVGALVLGTATAFMAPAVFAAVFGAVPAAERGSAGATTSLFIDLGLSGGPLAVGTIAAATAGGLGSAFVWCAIVPLVAGCVAYVVRPRQRVG